VLNQMNAVNDKGVVKDEDFLDPFTGIDKTKANQNTQFEKGKLSEVTDKARQKQKDALDKKIAEFLTHKSRIPPPQVKHEKGHAFNKDILVNNVTIIVGGKTLVENAQLKLTRGHKYGLVGRNGIGKTCLINAISRGELDNFPRGVHTLQVEQEIEGDEITVLQHILNCDVERNALLGEMDSLSSLTNDEMTEQQA
jgi:ATP-binding cassette, subfamily F, member 3